MQGEGGLHRAQTFAVTSAGNAETKVADTSAARPVPRSKTASLISQRCAKPAFMLRLGCAEALRLEPLSDRKFLPALVKLEVLCATPGAQIFVSLDGSDPELAVEAEAEAVGAAAGEVAAAKAAAAAALKTEADDTDAPMMGAFLYRGRALALPCDCTSAAVPAAADTANAATGQVEGTVVRVGKPLTLRALATHPDRRDSGEVASQPVQVVDERPVLVAIFNALAGASWHRRRGWGADSETPIDEWDGVAVENGWVVGLELEANNLVGELPGCVGELRRLERLNMAHNALNGVVPTSLAGCRQLRQLLLHDNRLRGAMPCLTPCTKLEHVFVQHNDAFDNVDGVQRDFAEHPNATRLHLFL